jgi:hypothetical protein
MANERAILKQWEAKLSAKSEEYLQKEREMLNLKLIWASGKCTRCIMHPIQIARVDRVDPAAAISATPPCSPPPKQRDAETVVLPRTQEKAGQLLKKCGTRLGFVLVKEAVSESAGGNTNCMYRCICVRNARIMAHHTVVQILTASKLMLGRVCHHAMRLPHFSSSWSHEAEKVYLYFHRHTSFQVITINLSEQCLNS